MHSVGELAGGMTPSLGLDADGVPTTPLLVVDLADAAGSPAADLAAAADTIAASLLVAVGVGGPPDASAAAPLTEALTCVVEGDDDLARVTATVAVAPIAAVTFAALLRQTAVLDVPSGLLAESAAYSTLLAGPEFAAWLRERGPARPHPTHAAVTVERSGDRLDVVLDHPERRNAIDSAMRDGLVEALQILAADPALHMVLTGAGPHFSSGGDLDEFGTAPDPATAHVVRSEQSVGRLMYADRDRILARVHGVCIGAGVEIPAFAGRVVAAPDATFTLPELRMGLVPGAGGTVSLPRRVGRARTAWLGLTGRTIDASTALRWALVDAVE